jgi:hypothetical protein
LVGSSRTSSQAEALPHAGRVRLDRPPPDPVEADPAERVVDPPPAVLAAAGSAWPGRVEQRQVRPAGQVGVEPGPFHQRADLGQHRSRRAGHGPAEHLDAPGGGEHQAEQHAHGGGLAGAVGAEEAEQVALADLQVDAVHGDDAAVPLGQPLGADHRVAHHDRTPSRASSAAARSSTGWETVPASA